MKNKYNIVVILVAMGLLYLYDSNTQNGVAVTENKKPVFFERLPAGMKKARQVVDINIDYEKLPGRNDIRLVGRVNAAHLPSDILDYKWVLADNIKFKSGEMSGKINLRVSNEVTLDVSIKDMHKKISVKLQASVRAEKVKLGGVKTFTYDPMNEGEKEANSIEAQQNKVMKTQSENLSKEDYLKQQMQVQRKISAQQ